MVSNLHEPEDHQGRKNANIALRQRRQSPREGELIFRSDQEKAMHLRCQPMWNPTRQAATRWLHALQAPASAAVSYIMPYECGVPCGDFHVRRSPYFRTHVVVAHVFPLGVLCLLCILPPAFADWTSEPRYPSLKVVVLDHHPFQKACANYLSHLGHLEGE